MDHEWLADLLTWWDDWLTDWLSDWSNDSAIHSFNNWGLFFFIGWLNIFIDWLINWLIGWVIDPMKVL